MDGFLPPHHNVMVPPMIVGCVCFGIWIIAAFIRSVTNVDVTKKAPHRAPTPVVPTSRPPPPVASTLPSRPTPPVRNEFDPPLTERIGAYFAARRAARDARYLQRCMLEEMVRAQVRQSTWDYSHPPLQDEENENVH